MSDVRDVDQERGDGTKTEILFAEMLRWHRIKIVAAHREIIETLELKCACLTVSSAYDMSFVDAERVTFAEIKGKDATEDHHQPGRDHFGLERYRLEKLLEVKSRCHRLIYAIREKKTGKWMGANVRQLEHAERQEFHSKTWFGGAMTYKPTLYWHRSLWRYDTIFSPYI